MSPRVHEVRQGTLRLNLEALPRREAEPAGVRLRERVVDAYGIDPGDLRERDEPVPPRLSQGELRKDAVPEHGDAIVGDHAPFVQGRSRRLLPWVGRRVREVGLLQPRLLLLRQLDPTVLHGSVSMEEIDEKARQAERDRVDHGFAQRTRHVRSSSPRNSPDASPPASSSRNPGRSACT